MIIQETLGNGLIKTVSDSGKYLIQNETGIKYPVAIDIPNHYTYSESDESIPVYEEISND